MSKRSIETLKVHLKGTTEPARILVEAIRNKVFTIMPKTPLERKFMFKHMLSWWLPAARNTGEQVTVHKGMVTDFQATKTHHVCVNKHGEVIGLYFGNLKCSTTKRFEHLWHKRFMVRPEGIVKHDQKAQLPCHLDEDEWELWWRMLITIVEEQLEDVGTRHGTKVFDDEDIAPLNREHFGADFGSFLSRMLFRNTYKQVDNFFIETVMQHGQECDQHYYVKPRLMNGPW